jgi:uncharacterized membrane protein YfcA
LKKIRWTKVIVSGSLDGFAGALLAVGLWFLLDWSPTSWRDLVGVMLILWAIKCAASADRAGEDAAEGWRRGSEATRKVFGRGDEAHPLPHD